MKDRVRTLRWAAWLGWQIESNWTQPWLFVIYMMAKPFTGSLLLVCMFSAVRLAPGSAVAPEFLPFLYVGNACYLLVGAIMFGMSWAVISDRENYGMLKYVYISPARLGSYLVGRGLARGIQAALGAVLTLGLGVLLFRELRSALGGHAIAWLWLAVYLVVGVAMLICLGMILAAAVLNTTRQGTFLSEGVAGVLYLLTGAVFPISVLPAWLRPISLALPPTYWLEGLRRVLLGESHPGNLASPLAAWSYEQLAWALSASTLVLACVAHLFFRWSEWRAWRLGRIDETSSY